MRLHRFYLTLKINKEKINSFLNPDIVHQLSHVFRLHAGDKVIFFDGSGIDYVSEIVSMNKGACEFQVHETVFVKRPERKVTLAVSMIKKDKFEWVIEKGTELGVVEFIPLVSERSEKKGFNMERARRIMIEAVEQSGRGDLPVIHEPQFVDEFIESERRQTIVFHTSGDNFVYGEIHKIGELVACVGPEGGWTEKEISMFENKSAVVVKLDTPVLRAETAAIAIAAITLVG